MAETDDGATYDLLELLERLESIREELDELGIRSFDELNQRIAELHASVDETEGESA